MEELTNLMLCGWIIKFDYDQSAPHKAMTFFWEAKNGFYNLKSEFRFVSPEYCIADLIKTLKEIDKDME